MKDLGSKTVLDAFTCVECGRCQVNCPAWGAGKELNPKTIILQTQEALLGGRARDASSASSTPRRCSGSARPAAPARTSARSASSTCRSSSARGAAWCRTATRPTIWAASTTTSSAAATSGGSATISARSSSTPAALEIFDPAKHDVLVWLGCAGAFEADFQKSLRSLFEILRAQQRPLRRAVEGALHRRSGQADRQRVHVPGAGQRRTSRTSRPPARRRSSTSCPHCVKTIGDDYRRVRLRGRDRALGGLRRGADARRCAGAAPSARRP